MPENATERFLTETREVRSTRYKAPETSFYPALEGLLTAIGKTLSPPKPNLDHEIFREL